MKWINSIYQKKCNWIIFQPSHQKRTQKIKKIKSWVGLLEIGTTIFWLSRIKNKILQNKQEKQL